MLKISLLILYFQAINSGICWTPNEPLILNKNENGVFFPLYVSKRNADGDSSSAMTYVEPGDKTSSTYTFCTDYSTHGEGLTGISLENDPARNCKFSVDFTRDQVKALNDDKEERIPCGNKVQNGIPKYWKYRVYFKLLIDGQKFIQDSYNYCYDHNKSMSTLYAYYDLKNPSLLKNKYLAEEQNFKIVLEKPTFDGSEFDLFTNIYDKQDEFEPYEVAVSDFIPFGHWRRSFYQWHNTAPLNKMLTEPWKTFIKNVRAKLAEKTVPIKVVSGIQGIKQSGDKIQHLPHSNITIPLARWIVLYNEDKSNGVALVLHNYIFGDGEAKPVQWCDECKCDKAGLKSTLPEADEYGRKVTIYCCLVSEIVPIVTIPKEILPPATELLMFEEKKE